MILYLILAAVGLVFLLAIVRLFLRPTSTGFAGKTLWDWFDVFGMPATVGLGAMVLSLTQMAIQDERAREEAVQSYIDRISALVTDGVEETDIAVGRAQTGAIFRQVKKDRAGRVLLFLSEIGLLREFGPNLEFVDLGGADLKGMSFAGLDFEGSNLRRSELEDADLSDTDFENADLRGADMKDADLRRADFDHAWLARADLDHADLRGANLLDATGVTSKQLGRACLDETTILPRGLLVELAEITGCTGRAEDD